MLSKVILVYRLSSLNEEDEVVVGIKKGMKVFLMPSIPQVAQVLWLPPTRHCVMAS